jgi:DNA-binding transcriptional regulator YhcF (GntR family)
LCCHAVASSCHVVALTSHVVGARTIRIYHKDQQVYTEKEIFALAAKAGINTNSIQQIHDGLVDDGLVDKQKIGGSNFFWSFKGKKDRQAQIQHQETLKLIEELKPKLEEAKATLADAKRGREDNEEDNDDENSRANKLARLAELSMEKAALEKELEGLRENDPAALADL